MKHLFVPYEIALIAKAKGFNELCFGRFNKYKELIYVVYSSNKSPFYHTVPDNEIAAPLYQQVVDWFREEHGIFIAQDLTVFDTNAIEMKKSGGPFGFCRRRKTGCEIVDISKETNYYQALTKALEEAFKLI